MFLWFIVILSMNILYTKQFILDQWFCTQDYELLIVSSFSRIYIHFVYSSYSKQDFLFIFPFSSTITDTTIYKTTLKKTNVVFLGVEWWCLKERDDVLENPHGLLLSLPQMLLLLCKFLSHWLGLLFLFNLLNLFEKTYQVKHNKESVRKKSWPILWVLKMKNSERKILQSEQWTEICPGLFCMFRDFSK